VVARGELETGRGYGRRDEGDEREEFEGHRAEGFRRQYALFCWLKSGGKLVNVYCSQCVSKDHIKIVEAGKNVRSAQTVIGCKFKTFIERSSPAYVHGLEVKVAQPQLGNEHSISVCLCVFCSLGKSAHRVCPDLCSSVVD
jgi:hypothetical protein